MTTVILPQEFADKLAAYLELQTKLKKMGEEFKAHPVYAELFPIEKPKEQGKKSLR
jgi:hypothetical protein